MTGAEVKDKFRGLQILRFVAATMVVAAHLWVSDLRHFQQTARVRLLDNGVMGVDIFFGISGFVIYLSAAHSVQRHHGGLQVAKEFFRRRFFRVAPSYYLLTILKLLVFLAAPGALAFFRPNLLNTVASFLFAFRFSGGDVSPPVLPVGWTLCYEMLFYLVVSAMLLTRAKLLAGCACVLGVAAVTGLLLTGRGGVVAFLFNPIELEFLAGMVIAAYLPFVRKIPKYTSAALLLGALGYGLFRVDGGAARNLTELHYRCFAVCGLLTVVAIVALEEHVRFDRFPLLLLLGDASYALYLTHEFVIPPILYMAAHLMRHTWLSIAISSVTALTFCYGVAVLYHQYVENPMTRYFLRILPWSMRTGNMKSKDALA